ncbi:14294_t:CDS:1 [Cetraspora pellucida]|uniref:14294_t:CDS:1 n=1 Tax=Cetraspora pellucida TaxID=1433469 RepID=A0ACA9LXK9_9GLOM|nr:14294_t:CDS:1 [Cetraspora pellucida]
MNPKTFNLFLIFFSCLLAFTIFVNAKYKPTKPCKNCCLRSGKGWTNKCHRGTIQYATRKDNIRTAEKCCKECLLNDNCKQWTFGSSDNLGLSAYNGTVSLCFLYCNDALPGVETPEEATLEIPSQMSETTLGICKLEPMSSNDLFECGVIRCPGEGCFNN